MTPMCSTTTGELVGWATATVSCDGTNIDIEYYNTSGIFQSGTLPGNWTVCRPTFSSNVVVAIVEITQSEYDGLVSKDPNTLYIITGP